MMELVVLSGKGGTGKTSVVASLAVLAGRAVIADCDVDAPDLHLVLAPEVRARHDFVAGFRALVDPDLCNGCGECERACRFDAVACAAGGSAVVEDLACEGCGVCARVCPEQAFRMVERTAGEWMLSRTRCGPMVHARLAVGGSSSGKLVALVRQQARIVAQLDGRELILVDGPPGIGCPVIASLTGASAVLVVTEPTPSGTHDLERVLELAGHFKVPVAVCVNRWDLHPEGAASLEARARAAGAVIAGRIAYDPAVTAAQMAGVTVVEHGGHAAADIRSLWGTLGATFGFAAARPTHHQAERGALEVR
jgi:MinD superfamily P-loop ATPase